MKEIAICIKMRSRIFERKGGRVIGQKNGEEELDGLWERNNY